MFDPREDRYTELRRRELLHMAARYRFSRHMRASRAPGRALVRRVIVWAARRLIAVGVRLFLLSKSWEQGANPVYNDVSEYESRVTRTIAE